MTDQDVLDAAREYAAACTALEAGKKYSVTRVNEAVAALLAAAVWRYPSVTDEL